MSHSKVLCLFRICELADSFLNRSKCNRGSPCDSCIKRNKESSCEYADKTYQNKPKTSTVNRLQSLENLVLQFLQNGVSQKQSEGETSSPSGISASAEASAEVSTAADVPQRAEERGTLHVEDGQMNYVDSSHWLSILNEIKDVRDQLSSSSLKDEEDRSFEENRPQRETDLVFGQPQCRNTSEIMQSLPPRSVCDILLSQYFNSQYMVIRESTCLFAKLILIPLAILHPLKFQDEYERFWQDSSKVSILWIGLLFSVLSLATILRQVANTTLPTEFGEFVVSPKIFRLKTTECLALGNYTAAKAYGLEAMVLYLQGNLIGLGDTPINLWFLMGIIIRLAMRMGYHRDPKNHPNITPFESEMRRRLWATIFQLDVLTSFQLGLPSMIPTDFCDTETPRNLNFSDFSPTTVVLPPGRPLSDDTLVVYTIIKSRIMAVFKKILANTQSIAATPLETTIMLDLEIRETYNKIPSYYKMLEISRSFMDSPSIIMKRYSLELLYLKGLVVLHRPFLNKDASDIKYKNLRRSCLDAAMQILARQTELHRASQLGGQLYEDRWMLSWLAPHDFLVAAMVVCLELSQSLRTPSTSRVVDFTKQLDALQTSYRIWTSRTSHNPESKESQTAAKVLELMIRKVEESSTHTISASISTRANDHQFMETDLTLVEPLAEMIDGSENLDWVCTIWKSLYSLRSYF